MTRADRARLLLVSAATIVTVLALVLLRHDAGTLSRVVAGYIAFLASFLPGTGAGGSTRRTASVGSMLASDATRAERGALRGVGVYAAAEMAALLISGGA